MRCMEGLIRSGEGHYAMMRTVVQTPRLRRNSRQEHQKGGDDGNATANDCRPNEQHHAVKIRRMTVLRNGSVMPAGVARIHGRIRRCTHRWMARAIRSDAAIPPTISIVAASLVAVS